VQSWILQAALTALAAAAPAGCLKVDTRIRLNPDGGATITERLCLSEGLLDLGGTSGGGAGIADVLSKAAALRRMKQMGEGVRLVRHEIRGAEKGARESLAVFEIGDIRKFRYVSPFLAFEGYPQHSALVCELFPVYVSTWYGRRAGQMAVAFKPAHVPRRGSPEEPPPPPPPQAVQILRDLHPIFRDLLAGFHLKLTFSSYAPIRMRQYYRYRNMRAATRDFDLIDFAAADLDRFGANFLDNEEVVLELLRGRISGPNVVEHTKEHGTNMTVPVYHPRGVPEIYFNPSRALFDRHFRGKVLDFGERHGGKRPARFEEVGYTPKPQTRKANGGGKGTDG
jgi:hypothetical protein